MWKQVGFAYTIIAMAWSVYMCTFCPFLFFVLFFRFVCSFVVLADDQAILIFLLYIWYEAFTLYFNHMRWFCFLCVFFFSFFNFHSNCPPMVYLRCVSTQLMYAFLLIFVHLMCWLFGIVRLGLAFGYTKYIVHIWFDCAKCEHLLCAFW